MGERFLQKRNVLSNQEQTERQHPEAQDGENTEDAAEDEKQRKGNPHPPRRRLPHPADESGASLRKPFRNPLEVAVEFGPRFCAHVKTACSIWDCDTAPGQDELYTSAIIRKAERGKAKGVSG